MQARMETTLSKDNTNMLYRTELNYVYVLDRQVLDRGVGPYYDEAGCKLLKIFFVCFQNMW